MSRKTSDESQLKKMDKGGHLGGPTFGQAADAKTKDTRKGGDKARPNDGRN